MQTKEQQNVNLFKDIEAKRHELYEDALGCENLQFLNKFFIDYKELECEDGKYNQLRSGERRAPSMLSALNKEE